MAGGLRGATHCRRPGGGKQRRGEAPGSHHPPQVVKAMDMVAAMDREGLYRYGLVHCSRADSEVLCREALRMDEGPWVVLFGGVWQRGTTWEFNGETRDTWEATEANVQWLRDFVMGQWKLKVGDLAR